jgi:hypothetical protein
MRELLHSANITVTVSVSKLEESSYDISIVIALPSMVNNLALVVDIFDISCYEDASSGEVAILHPGDCISRHRPITTVWK